MKINKIIYIVSMLFIASVLLCGCNLDGRDFYADKIVEVPDSAIKLVIKEWRWLNGSGAYIYIQNDDDTETLLGETIGGGDGYCPFHDGKYEIINNGDQTITVKWYFDSDSNDDIWREKTFNISKSETTQTT